MGLNWRAVVEPGVAFALIILYIWWLRFRFPYVWIAILALLIASHLRKREGLRKLGFEWKMPRGSAKLWMVLGLIATVILAIGLIFHTIRQVTWQGACLSLLLYCTWGLVQQYILNGYFVNRFSDFLPHHIYAVAILAAICFSVVHLPNWFLMIVTLAGGYACARVYMHHRNLYFLGLAHGVIGFLIYLTVPDTISHHLYVGPKWFSM
ncbi:MAG TPA: CPBP family glutamic-type intramembrane protease [Bryobacteraceae bacterium]|nr:CPBP family glutamic-type intramembrane protease [Bryobacteraceae bacterium]